jgi:glucose/arabinose dehydrogenase
MAGYGAMLRYKWVLVVSLALLLAMLPLFILGKPASGADFVQSSFAEGLTNPTAMAFAPDGSLFVAEQRGTLQAADMDGQLQETPFLDIRGRVVAAGERGLLGVAFDPEFELGEPYVYVYYTRKGKRKRPPYNLVARFTASTDEQGNLMATPGSEEILLRLPNLRQKNHNGGAIHFGNADDANERDKLYVAVGENGRQSAAQSLGTVLGKMLRINKDGTMPSDNPFYERTTGTKRAIWELGLRNPYSFDIHQPGTEPSTGKIFINDVGYHQWEEINEGQAGANYGWPHYEGDEGPEPFDRPVYTYRHGFTETTGCAITGGAFYNPETPSFGDDYVGDYFFADFCTGWIRKLDTAATTEEEKVTPSKSGSNERPVDIKVSKEGELYFLARGGGSVEKISYTP